jgi:lipopolysaccharide export system protein LptA
VKLTQWLVISVFTGLCGSIALLSLLGNWDGGEYRNIKANSSGEKQNEESFFKNAEYFFLKDYKNSLTLEADEMAVDGSTGKSVFLIPKGVAYSGDGKPIRYKAKTGLLKEGKEELTLEGDVLMKVDLSTYSADKLEYNIVKDELISTGNVHSFSKSTKTGDEVEIQAESSLSYPKSEKSQYMGSVRGKILKKRAYEENILFNSNKLDLDMIKHQIDLLGAVRIKKQAFTANSLKGEIFLENYNKRLKYFVLYDDVKVVETISPGDGSASFTRRAFSEKLEGIVSEGKIILTGSPKVYQHKDVIKGNKIVLRENNEVVEVDDANTKFNLK